MWQWEQCLARLHTSLSKPAWSPDRATPIQRCLLPRRMFAHTSCLWGDRLLVFGGRHAHEHSARLELLDFSTRPLTWRTHPHTPTTPACRRQHTAVVDSKGRMHVVDPTNESFGRPVVWSHPAYAEKTAFIRNDKEIVAVDLSR